MTLTARQPQDSKGATIYPRLDLHSDTLQVTKLGRSEHTIQKACTPPRGSRVVVRFESVRDHSRLNSERLCLKHLNSIHYEC